MLFFQLRLLRLRADRSSRRAQAAALIKQAGPVQVADTSDGKFSEAADRYAAAAFDLALESNALSALEKDVDALAEALRVSGELRAVAQSPLIAAAEKEAAFLAIADKLKMSPMGRNVLGLIARNGRAALLPAFVHAVKARLAAHRGARQVEIVSAAPLDAAQLQTIVTGLSRALGADVEPVAKVDPSLIGGFVARAGSRQFDASIKTKLEQMKLALKTA